MPSHSPCRPTARLQAPSGAVADFAAAQLSQALHQGGWRMHGSDDPSPDLDIQLIVDPDLGAETHAISIEGPANGHQTLRLRGGDDNGLLYAALAAAESLHAGLAPAALAGAPIQPGNDIRAVKINLPWESYRRHDSLQLHAPTCRDIAFWRDLIDDLARARWNRLSLWSLHPWALMVRPTAYPEACDLDDGELAAWQAFWHSLFGHAHDRGLQVQIFTWNIFVSPAFARARQVATYSIDGDYLGDGDLSPLVEDYTREIVTEALRTFPEIDGLGITLSERMGGLDNHQRGAWIERTYGAAVRAAGRPLEINYRAPHSGSAHCNAGLTNDTMSIGRRLLEESSFTGPLLCEIKFNWSHGHSSPKLCLIHNGPPSDGLWQPPPQRYRLTWMVRNEDFCALRWCAPSFIRDHQQHNRQAWVAGYYIGSETVIPACNYIDRADLPHRAAWLYRRQRLFYAVWGRLLLDPQTDDQALGRLIEWTYVLPADQRGIGERLLPVLDAAGTIPLLLATFLGFTWDHTLYVEGMLTLEGFITVERFRTARPLDPDWLDIATAVAGDDVGKTSGLHPDAVATRLDDLAATVTAKAWDDPNSPLADELLDARTWAALGRYAAAKIRAALAIEGAARHPTTARQQHAQAAALLADGVGHWRQVVALTITRYQPFPVQHLEKTGRPRWHWQDWLALVEAEAAEAARTSTTDDPPPPKEPT